MKIKLIAVLSGFVLLGCSPRGHYTEADYLRTCTDTNNYEIVTDGVRFKVKFPSGSFSSGTDFATKEEAVVAISALADFSKARLRDLTTDWKPVP